MKKVSTAVAKQSRNISRQTLTIGLDLGDRTGSPPFRIVFRFPYETQHKGIDKRGFGCRVTSAGRGSQSHVPRLLRVLANHNCEGVYVSTSAFFVRKPDSHFSIMPCGFRHHAENAERESGHPPE